VSTSLVVLAEGQGYLFAVWRNLFLLDFRVGPTIEGLRNSVRAKQLARVHAPKGGLAVLNFLAPGPMPSAEVRQVAAEVQHKDTEDTLCHATVVEATGFAGSAMRGVLTGLNTFGRAPYPRKVFGDVIEALAWQATTLAAPPDWMPGARVAIEELKRRRTSA